MRAADMRVDCGSTETFKLHSNSCTQLVAQWGPPYTTFSTRTNNNHKRRGTVATATQQRTGTALLLWRVLRTLSSWWCALGLAELDKAAVRSKSMVA